MKDRFKSWYPILEEYLNSNEFKQLGARIAIERQKYQIVPKSEDVFKAFELCDYANLKVVILGQDPYPTVNTADGLCFSTKLSSTPPSLVQIKHALENSGFKPFLKNDLTRWAEQGVLLLNTSLTCQLGIADSHKNIGWESFIKFVLSKIPQDVCLITFGARALDFAKATDLKYFHCNHPAYFAYKGLKMTTDVFKDANFFLRTNFKDEVDWR